MAPLFYPSSASATSASVPLLPALMLILVLGPASREVLAVSTFTTTQTILRQLVPQLTNFNIVPYLTGGSPDASIVTVSTGGVDAGAPGFCNLLAATGSLNQIKSLLLPAGTSTSVFLLNASSTSVITFTFNLPTTGAFSIAAGPVAATFTTSSITSPVTGVPFTIPGSSIQSFSLTLTVTIAVPASSTTPSTQTLSLSGSGSTSGPISLAGFSCLFANAVTCNTQVGIDLGALPPAGALPAVSVNLGFSFTTTAPIQQGTDFTRK